jgi:hypothetical protein
MRLLLHFAAVPNPVSALMGVAKSWRVLVDVNGTRERSSDIAIAIITIISGNYPSQDTRAHSPRKISRLQRSL